MQKNTLVIAVVVALIVGLGGGYVMGKNKSSYKRNAPMNGEHMMHDGSMMKDDHMSMSDMMISMNAELKGKSGDAFDTAFLSEMIVHHEGAVEMAKLALTNAKHQEIKDLASAIITAQNKEIAEMKGWSKGWYNIK